MPVHSRSYVEALETRVKTLETRVKTLEALLEQRKAETDPGVRIIRHFIRDLNCPWPEPHSDDLAFVEIDKSFRSLSINSDSISQGFQGKSSRAMLVKVAVDIRNSVKNTSIADSTAHEVPRPIINKVSRQMTTSGLLTKLYASIGKHRNLPHRQRIPSQKTICWRLS